MKVQLLVFSALCVLGCGRDTQPPKQAGAAALVTSDRDEPTYGSILGREEIQTIVRYETRIAEVSVRDDFVIWSVNEIQPIGASPDPATARSELRQGFGQFVRGLGVYAREVGQREIDQRIAVRYRSERAVCGMIPCPPRKCCSRCRPCRAGKDVSDACSETAATA